MLPTLNKIKKILIVESSADVRKKLTELLEGNEYKVTLADDGYMGYKLAMNEQPDLIIADIYIQQMNGLEMLKLIRDNAYSSEIPFIFLTEKAATVDRRLGMNSGADDYLSIPFKDDDLLTSIKTRLEKKEKIDKKFNKVFRSISGNIPHELRTPLCSIIGFTNIILDDILTLNRQEIIDMLNNIKYSSLRLHRTIEKFIVFSEAEILNMDKANNENLLKKFTEINAFLFYSIIEERSIPEEPTPPININTSYGKVCIAEQYFTIMLGELIENAIKFSFAGGTIEISSEEDELTYTLKVKNYGRGMTEEEIKNLAPFLQINRQKYEQQGNGLGLMIVSSLAAFHNIKFDLVSVPNNYTIASLTFKKFTGVS